ncbi:hypothetical protein ACPB9J_33750 [Streptomyces lavendulocolor]|uniref:hypothetical protein n=1 Tax=Streptomyces lavendulocolor TaxID=67316 RepID=UPI003C2F637A
MKLDWERGHGPVTGPINAAAATLAASWAGHLTDMPWPTATVVASAGLIGSHIAGRRKNMTRHTLVMRAAGWLGAGGWSSWAIANGPWDTWTLTTLLAGAIGLGAGIAGAHAAEKNAPAKAAEAQRLENAANLDAKRQAIATEWTDRILRVTTVQTQIVGVETDTEGNLFTLDGECAEGGSNWKTIKRYEEALASDARLPEGCGVEVLPGANRGAFLMTVATANKLIDDANYPDDFSPLSINDGSPLGVHRDGTIGAPVMRQLSATFVGRRGSGKTNLMNVCLGNQVRQVDNLSWVIDLNGGGLALAWLHKWHELGRPGRPPIDWVADTPEKALDLAQAALRIAKARKPGYKKREIEANDDKLPVDATVPAITINNDEIAELFSPKARRDPILREVGDTLVQVQELARAVAVNTINAALRATQDVISEPQILVQSALKIGMKSDEREMNYLFGWDDRITPEDIPYAGCGAMKIEDTPARPIKIYRIKPQQIEALIKATADRQPELDDLSRKAAGEAYERRWENTDHLFGLADAPTPTTATAPSTGATATPAPGRGRNVTANWGTAAPAPSIKDDLADADDALHKLREAMNEATNHDDDLNKQFQTVVEQGGLTWQAPPNPLTDDTDGDTEATTDPRYQHIYRIVEGAGPAGIGPAAISDAFTRLHPTETPPNPTVIGRWLKADDRIHQPKFGRYALKDTGEAEPADGDDLTRQVNELMAPAMELVIAKQHASATFIQRQLRCPWDVANGILLVLVAAGIIDAQPDEHGNHRVLRRPDGPPTGE